MSIESSVPVRYVPLYDGTARCSTSTPTKCVHVQRKPIIVGEFLVRESRDACTKGDSVCRTIPTTPVHTVPPQSSNPDPTLNTYHHRLIEGPGAMRLSPLVAAPLRHGGRARIYVAPMAIQDPVPSTTSIAISMTASMAVSA